MQTAATDVDLARELAAKLIHFLETGEAPAGLFAPDLFLDFTMPLWRVQADTARDAIAARLAGHPSKGQVARSRFDRLDSGFLIEVEETWEQGGDSWYCRELMRADIRDGLVAELSVYCTGDWDSARQAEHRAAVTLFRP
jgi:hypothetical protein